jgi:hypothetical protein
MKLTDFLAELSVWFGLDCTISDEEVRDSVQEKLDATTELANEFHRYVEVHPSIDLKPAPSLETGFAVAAAALRTLRQDGRHILSPDAHATLLSIYGLLVQAQAEIEFWLAYATQGRPTQQADEKEPTERSHLTKPTCQSGKPR